MGKARVTRKGRRGPSSVSGPVPTRGGVRYEDGVAEGPAITIRPAMPSESWYLQKNG